MFSGSVLLVDLEALESSSTFPAYVYEVDGSFAYLLFCLGRKLERRMISLTTGYSYGRAFLVRPESLAALRAYVQEHYTYLSGCGRYWWTSGHRLWACTVGLSVVPSWSFYSPDVGAYLEASGFSIVDLR